MATQNAEESEKKLVSRREFLVGGGAIIATVALAACTTKTANTTTATTTPTLTPKYSGTLKYVTSPIPANIGWPPEMMGSAALEDCTACIEPLLRVDVKGRITPWLAESYKVDDDLKSISFNIRKGVKFHDGSDLNADVVKWNLDNLINAKTQPLWTSVDIIDNYTVRVNFAKWINTLPLSFCEISGQAFLVSKAAFEKRGIEWMRANPVGTGPFTFDSFSPDATLKFVKNPDYWIKNKPYLNEIEYKFIADPTTLRMVMQAGEGDWTGANEAKAMADYTAMGLDVKLLMSASLGLIPDTANPDSPWSNQKVREAVEYVIDREGIAKAFGYGYWQASYQIPSRLCLTYNKNFLSDRKYNSDKAKQLLAKAGYASGFETTLINFPMVGREMPVAIQNDLAKAGIKANLEFPDGGKIITYMGPGSWHNAVICTNIPTGDPYFSGGFRFLFDMIGQSWERTPELAAAYQDALTSPTQDIEKIRVFTDVISKGSLIFPITEVNQGIVVKPNVMADYDVFAAPVWRFEDVWLNK